MFSLLNNWKGMGKYPARLCKFLNSLSRFFHNQWRQFSCSFYLVDGERFRSGVLAEVGHRIALLSPQPVLHRIRSGKD